MKTLPLNKIFDVDYGVNLELNSLEENERGINFVSRTSKNNGVSAKVTLVDDLKPNPPGVLSVAGGGSVLETFLQKEPFYSGRDLYYLTPKVVLSDKEKLIYCSFIKANKFRYNYGRQANRTLADILIPSPDVVKELAKNISLPKTPKKDSVCDKSILFDVKKWEYFKFNQIFKIKKGYYNKKPPTTEDVQAVPFVGASENYNGITSYVKEDIIKTFLRNGLPDTNEEIENKIFKGNCITVANNGNSVASSFYQKNDFTCSHDINPLYLKNVEMNPYIAIFLCTLIKKEKYRWSYGRKWRPIRMENSRIKLPIDKNGDPDWQFMEDYIKSLPCSSNLQ